MRQVGWEIVVPARDNPGEMDGDNSVIVAPNKRIDGIGSGKVTAWVYKGEFEGPFRAIIFRPDENSDTRFEVVGFNDIPSNEVGVINYEVPEADRIEVQDGDVIGWSHQQAVFQYDNGGPDNILYRNSALQVGEQNVTFDNSDFRQYSIEAVVKANNFGGRAYYFVL